VSSTDKDGLARVLVVSIELLSRFVVDLVVRLFRHSFNVVVLLVE